MTEAATVAADAAGAGDAAFAARVKDAVGTLGGAWMLDVPTRERGKALGAGSWGFYMVGRGGVLGDVDPEVVRAAFGFFPAETVRRGWEKARAVLTPAEAVAEYAAAAAQFGRTRLAGFDAPERLAELLAPVVEAADPVGRPVFAGWRAVALPDDPRARVVQLAHVLREFRGGSHLIAVVASGLTPLQSVLAGGGPGNASFFGWPEPYDDASALVPLRDRAEALTDRLAAAPWGVLSDAERAEAADLLDRARATALASL